MARRVLSEAIKREIVNLYVNDRFCSLSKIARKYNCSRFLVTNALKSHKIPIRSQSDAQRKPRHLEDSDKKRFWDKVKTQGNDQCWPWTASTDLSGYGRFGFREILLSAHRVAWEITYGDIPFKKHVLHHCDNPRCCNPEHLFIGTHQDNMADRDKKGRGKTCVLKGEKNPNSRFKEVDIIEMRGMVKQGYKQGDVAKKFNTAQSVISNIINYKNWKHIS